MRLGTAIEHLVEAYKYASDKEWIQDKVAWALYHTWKDADRKTENSSEIPNNCTDCEHWSDTEDGCADRHGCKTTEDCSTVKPQNYCDDCLYCDTCDSKEFFYACTSKATISKMEQVDEPQYEMGMGTLKCDNCSEYGSFKCTKCDGEMYFKRLEPKTEPQTERSE